MHLFYDFFCRFLGPLSASLGAVMMRSKLYLVSTTTTCSKVGYMFAENILSIVIFTGILSYKNKLDLLSSVDKKVVSKVMFYSQLPFFFATFFILKAFGYNVVIANAIFSLSPFIDLLKERFITKKYKYICDNNQDNLIQENLIVINKSKSIITKEDVFALTYLISVYLFYLDGKKINTSYSDHLIDTVLFSASAAVLMYFCRNNTKAILQEKDSEVVIYLRDLCSFPIIAMVYITAIATDNIDIKDDLSKEYNSIVPILFLSLLNVFYNMIYTYSLNTLKHVSDFSVINVLSGNVVALFLEKGFDLDKFTIYSNFGILLTFISSAGIMINAREKMEKGFINIVLSQLQNLENIDSTQMNKMVKHEWNTNKDFYKNLQCNDKILSTGEYNELLLVLLSKILSASFKVQDSQSNVKLIINNLESVNNKIINFKVMFEDNNSELIDKMVTVSSQELVVSEMNLELIGV